MSPILLYHMARVCDSSYLMGRNTDCMQINQLTLLFAWSPVLSENLDDVILSMVTLFIFSFVSTANICDNELLRCQNGGVCHNSMRCLCPSGYTGILCEKCEDSSICLPNSGQNSISHNLYLITMILVTRLCTF